MTRAVAFVVALLSSLSCLPGSALCIGADHSAIEVVGSDCAPAAASATNAAADPTDALWSLSASVHGCSDTPLGAPGVQSTTDPSQGLRVVAIRTVAVPPPVAIEPAPVAASPWARSSSVATRLSTVLLL